MKKLRNKFEKKINRQLKRAKAIFTYEGEKIPYIIASHYTPDFIVDTKTGRIYIEAKGYFRAEDKRKFLAVKRQHPNLDLRLLFYNNNRGNIRWAEKNRILYAIERIPKEWLDGH